MVTVEDRTAYFLNKLEAMWPNRLALSVKETAQTLSVMFGVKHGTGAEELVRRAIKSGRLIPGLGRPAGRQWRIPLYDLAHHFGQGFQPHDVATATKVTSAKTPPTAKQTITTPPPKRRGRAAIVPSTSFLEDRGLLQLHANGETETWQWAAEPELLPVPLFATETEQKRHQAKCARTEQIWRELYDAINQIRARERAEESMTSSPPSLKRRRPSQHS